MFALGPDVSTVLQPVTQASETGVATPTLAVFIEDHAADALYQTAAAKLGKVVTATTV